MSIFDTVKLGRGELRVDPRTIQYRTLAPSPWRPPPAYDFDTEHGDIFPARMYLNDTYGDCVMAAQANQITRLEYDEQGALITITDAEVQAEYFSQTGGSDSGLDPIASLNKWRRGWTAAGKVYAIHSWASVSSQDKQQMSEATIVGRGLQCGVRLPISAAHQMDLGQPWDLVAGPDGEAGSWGNHMVYLVGYDDLGVTFWTWKRRQRATWLWVASYCDFAAIAIDAVDRVAGAINTEALTAALGNL